MKKINLLLILCLGGVLASCGGGGDLAASGNSQGMIGTGSAVNGAISSFQSSFIQNNIFNRPQVSSNGTIPLPAFASVYDACTTFVIGSATSDEHHKRKFSCHNIDAGLGGGKTVNYVGSYELKGHDDPTKPGYGYRMDFDLLYEILGSDLGDNWSSTKGFHELKKEGSSFVASHDVTYRTVMLLHKPSVDWSYRSTMKRIHYPDNMASPHDSGKATIEAFYKLEGKVGGGPGGVDLGISKVTFEITSEDLEYDRTCTYYYVKGSISYKDGANNILKHTFDPSCTSAPTVTYNGKVITL